MDGFIGYPKTPRLYDSSIIVTEKIDGTNAQVVIETARDRADRVLSTPQFDGAGHYSPRTNLWMRCGSRNRWITPEADNAGFARWAYENVDELTCLGPGQHFGEWWGKGIQRGYGLDEKRFSLFNTGRWSDAETRPKCCHVVPVLHEGPFCTAGIDLGIEKLAMHGSFAAPGFMKTEGVIVFITAANKAFKVITDK